LRPARNGAGQILERIPAGVPALGHAFTVSLVAVLSARRAEPPALRPTKALDGTLQKYCAHDLFRQVHRSRVRGNPEYILFQPFTLYDPADPEFQPDTDRGDKATQTTVAQSLQFRVQVSLCTVLPAVESQRSGDPAPGQKTRPSVTDGQGRLRFPDDERTNSLPDPGKVQTE
jgi:hypothetical protein